MSRRAWPNIHPLTPADSCDAEHDFAELRAGFEIFVGLAAFFERKDFVDHRLELAIVYKFQDGRKLVLASHVRTENGELPHEQETNIEPRVVAGRGTTGNQTAAGSEASDAIVPNRCPDVLEDDIHSALFGELANGIANIFLVMMNRLIGAKLFCLGELFVRACGSDHAAGKKSRNLNRGRSDAAPCAKNKDIFSGSELRSSH